MFQASPDGLSIADSAHRVLWANETFARMFDYAAAEVVGQSLEHLVVPPDRLAESRWVWEALARGERITLETKRRKKKALYSTFPCRVRLCWWMARWRATTPAITIFLIAGGSRL